IWEARRGPTTGSEPLTLTAELWMQNPHTGGGATLQTAALLGEGIRIDSSDVSLGILGAGDTAQHVVRVWATTRKHPGKPEIVWTGAPFVTCSEPTPLTGDDIAELVATQKERGTIHAGYRFTIAVREQTPNGERFDEGIFTHQVTIKPAEQLR